MRQEKGDRALRAAERLCRHAGAADRQQAKACIDQERIMSAVPGMFENDHHVIPVTHNRLCFATEMNRLSQNVANRS